MSMFVETTSGPLDFKGSPTYAACGELAILGVKRVFIFLLLILVLSYHFMSFITSNPGQKRVLICCYERRKS